MMTRKIILMILILATVTGIAAWSQFAIGAQLSVTVEPDDNHRNTVEINIAPLIAEYRVATIAARKAASIVNLRLTPGEPAAVSHVGAGVSVPIRPWATVEQELSGFSAGPVVGYTYNLADKNHNVTLAAEIGYGFAVADTVVLNVTGEVGVTWFDTMTDTSDVVKRNVFYPHLGVKPQIVVWLSR